MLTPNDLVPKSYGISSGADQVAAADLRRIEAEARGALVHQPLADEVALGTPGRAQRPRRRLVRHHAPEVARVVRHAIGAGQQRGAELGGHERRRPHVGADVGVDHRAHADDAAVGVEADLDLPRVSRAWLAAMRFSRRVSIHFTGRPSFMAASGTRMSSG